MLYKIFQQQQLLVCRKRECDNPKPFGLGYPCAGPDIEEIPCTNQCGNSYP